MSGDEVGVKRILNDVFHETLVEYRPGSYYLKYSIDDGPSPVSCDEVSNYYGIVQLTRLPGDEGTQVEWSSSWDSKSKDAVEFCHTIYLALLSDLSDYYQ
ncbi:MAG: hypothetical protein KZQ77_14160 [Candidatus Thiodiazotropha sp. (ex Notomyrtea botanica)]|nr:hypothetical protein [Candidatus Thiodiazotropha sp. (ex Notomyrtea botanica)]